MSDQVCHLELWSQPCYNISNSLGCLQSSVNLSKTCTVFDCWTRRFASLWPTSTEMRSKNGGKKWPILSHYTFPTSTSQALPLPWSRDKTFYWCWRIIMLSFYSIDHSYLILFLRFHPTGREWSGTFKSAWNLPWVSLKLLAVSMRRIHHSTPFG